MVNRSPKAARESAAVDVDDDEGGVVKVDHADDDPVTGGPQSDESDIGDIEAEGSEADSSAIEASASEEADGSGSEAASAAESPQLTGLRGYLAQRGLSAFASAENDEAAAAALLESTTQWLTRAQQAQQAAEQQAAWYYQQLANQQAMAQQQQPVQQAEPAKSKWEAPEYDPGWSAMLTRDENGHIVAKPGADPTLPAKYIKWQQHQAKVAERLATDPAGFLEELGYVSWETAQQRFQDQLVNWQNQFLEQQVLNQRIQENLGWMVEVDQNQRPVVDPQTGRYRPTVWGNKFYNYLTEAQSRGIGTPEAQFEYARRSVEAEAMEHYVRQQQGAAGGKTPAEGQAEKNLKFLRDAATRKPSKTGTVEKPGLGRQPAQNGRRLSFMEKAKRNAIAAGVDWNSEIE